MTWYETFDKTSIMNGLGTTVEYQMRLGDFWSRPTRDDLKHCIHTGWYGFVKYFCLLVHFGSWLVGCSRENQAALTQKEEGG